MDTTALNQAITDLEAECQHKDYHGGARAAPYTPVQLASERGNHEIVSALADGGANLNATSTSPYGGFTPLGYAIRECHPETVRVLVEKGADPNLKPCTYPVTFREDLRCWEAFVATPLFMARREGRTDIVKILIDGGADHNIRNAKGQTVLHESVTDISMLKCLLDNGADLSATDNKGRTPRDIVTLLQAVYVWSLSVAEAASPQAARVLGAAVVALTRGLNRHEWVGYKETITCIDTHITQVNSECRMTASTTRQKGLPEVMDGEIMAFLKH